MQHYTIDFKPDGKQIKIHAGATILEAAGQAGIILNTVCGGSGTCGKCAVVLEPHGKKVFACKHIIDEDLVVTIPSTSRFFEQKIIKHGIAVNTVVEPTVQKNYIKLNSFDKDSLLGMLRKTAVSSDFILDDEIFERITKSAKTFPNCDITIVSHLLPVNHDCSSNCVYNVVDVEKGDTCDQIYGIAVDIGTTTVAANLLDMITGNIKATAPTFNPQMKFGDDVISRISYGDSPQKLQQLQKTILDCINELVNKLCTMAAVNPLRVYEVAIAGNTTMNHLFLGLPVAQLGQAPYKAHSVNAHDVSAGGLGIEINPLANIHTIENIAGFVGSDTTAAALATDIDSAKNYTLLIDIGTNGELVIGTNEKLYSASCAAGPALEGARIRCGSRAVDGAIEGVVINLDDIDIDVIASRPASSICGSGLIDAVSVMLDLGIIDETGRFADKESLACDKPKILDRIIEIEGHPAFVLAWQPNTKEPAVYLSQGDIRQFQLAKAAIRAGIILLQKKLGITDADLKSVLLAGAFGNYIKKQSALRTGLAPQVKPECIHFVGNAASSGAQMVLLSRRARAAAKKLAAKIEYVEIAHDPQFTMVYSDCMFF